MLVVFGTIVSWMLLDAFRAHCRTVTNMRALGAGLLHRFRSKVRQDTKGRPLYPIFKTNMHTKGILGPDVALFMNWFVLVAAVSIYLTVLALIFNPTGDAEICMQLRKREGENRTMLIGSYKAVTSDHVAMWTGFSYVGSVALSAIFFWMQDRLRKKLAKEMPPSLHVYAVELTGFPANATDHVELSQFVDGNLDAMGILVDNAIADISICYDYESKFQNVQYLIDEHWREVEHAMSETTSSQTNVYLTSSENRLMRRVTSGSTSEGSKDSQKDEILDRPGPFWVQVLGYFLLGADFDYGPLHGGGAAMSRHSGYFDDYKEHNAALLNSLDNSGTVIVVFRTHTLACAVSKWPALPNDFRNEHTIRVADVLEEPSGIEWCAFTRNSQWKKRVALSVFIMLVVLTTWAMLYIPWAVFSAQALNDTSNSTLAIGTLVGGMVALGNALVSQTVCVLTEFVKFKYKSRMRKVQLLIIVPCVLINIFCDVGVTLYAAYTKHNESFPKNTEGDVDYGVALLQKELFILLVPGYIAIPYIGEPLATVLLPLWIGIWRIKADCRISPETAERMMLSGEIDIVNPPLCDLILVTSTFMFSFLWPAKDHWMFFIALVFFSALIYFVNRIRILRWQTAVYFSTSALHTCECYLWMLPLAFLAASFGRAMSYDDSVHNTSVHGIFAFMAHCLLHYILVRYVLPSWNKDKQPLYLKPYHEVQRKMAASYRNTNPIEVLKSRLTELPDVPWMQGLQGPLIMCTVGREHLQSKEFSMRNEVNLIKICSISGQVESVCDEVRSALHDVGEGLSSTARSLVQSSSTKLSKVLPEPDSSLIPALPGSSSLGSVGAVGIVADTADDESVLQSREAAKSSSPIGDRSFQGKPPAGAGVGLNVPT